MSDPVFDLVIDCSGGPDVQPQLVELDPTDLPPPYVPFRVSRLQAKLTLSLHGLLAAVEAAIAEAGQTQPAIPLYWAETSHIERNHFGLAFIANLMGWDGAFLDALFVEAAGYL